MDLQAPRHEISDVASPGSSIAHLRGLVEVTRLLRGEHQLSSVLDAIARTVCESLGFETVVITLYRPAWNDFEVTAVHGSEKARSALQGTVREWGDLAPLMDERFCRRGAYFIPHNEFDWSSIDGASFVPDIEATDEPGAWHPEDALLVPLLRADGSTLGIISVDEPASGRTPTDTELEVLVAVAAHCALAAPITGSRSSSSCACPGASPNRARSTPSSRPSARASARRSAFRRCRSICSTAAAGASTCAPPPAGRSARSP
jgi:transcriptional regulator with GAF, ATPase, and Fis domain